MNIHTIPSKCFHRPFAHFLSVVALMLSVAMAGVPAQAAEPGSQGAVRTIAPKWRGNSVVTKVLTPELIELMAQFHCNVLRIVIHDDTTNPAFREKLKKQGLKAKEPTSENPLGPYEESLRRVDEMIPLCRKHGIQIVLAAGGMHGSKLDLFYELDANERGLHLIPFWQAMSRRYKDEPVVVAYDIKNEPDYPDEKEAARMWWGLQLPRSIEVIREVDKTVWLVVEAPPVGGMPWGFSQMPAIKDPRVIYSFHHYMAHAYTHQGVLHLTGRGPDTRGKYAYPGNAPGFDRSKDEAFWDKEALEQTMKEVMRFQERVPGARVYVGEFGVIRWATGAAQWLKDSIDIFEKHGWDWSLNSLGGWPGWCPTYEAADDKRRPTVAGGKNTDRLEVLKAGWLRNLEPSPTTSEDTRKESPK